MDRSRWPVMSTTFGVAFSVLALGLLFLQVEVSVAGPARACGSAFDAAVDRSGWTIWWDQDLDDPHTGNREALVRTSACPSAVNNRLVTASLLAAVGSVAVAAGVGLRSTERTGARASTRLRSLGAVTACIGLGLTIAGVVAVVFLVADADSTLFLYTDRLVVALAGVVVLVPAVALAVGGLALRAVGDLLDRAGDPSRARR